MKVRREKIEKQNYAARVLGDLMGGREAQTRLGKRSIDKLEEEEELSEGEASVARNREKKKKKSEKKEKKSKKSKKSESKKSSSQDKNVLAMAQEFSQEYEPIKARRMKISSKAGESAELNSSLLSLDTSQDDKDYGLNVEVSGDVMKDLDEILNN